MRIFITGASGFVGGAAAQKLQHNHEIIAMARSQESKEKIEKLGIKAVVCELGSVTIEHLQDCDVVLHCAAFVEEWGDKKQFWKINVEGTKQLLEVAKEAGVKRFIHISTESVLFCGQHLRNIDESYSYPQKTPILYSRTKAAAEQEVIAANDPESSFATIILRPRFIWGPGDTTILPTITKMVKQKKFVWIGNGHYQTSTVYIDNLVHAIDLALTKGKAGQPYFITDNDDQDMRNFLTKMLKVKDINLPKKSVPRWLARSAATTIEFIWKTIGIKKQPPITRHAVYTMSCDCTLKIDQAQNDLGYQPIVSIEDGLQKI